MKIKTVNLINVVGMNRTLEAKDFQLTADVMGVVVEPKGQVSFRNRPRIVPWANISSCDIFTEEELEKMQMDEARREEARQAASVPPPADPVTVPLSAADPVVQPEPVVDDTIRFTKDAAGRIEERKGPAPVADVKSAFAAVAKAKATKPE